MAGSRMPKLDFSRLESAEQPEFGSQYSKDYWDIVFEQLGKRALFKVGVVVLTLLYGVAAFAPLIANDRPYHVDSVDIGGFKKATRVRPMVSEALKVVEMSDEAYAASIEDSTGVSPPDRVSKARTELAAAELRVATMRSMITPEQGEPLDVYLAAFRGGIDALESGDDEEAARLLGEAKTAARAIGKDLKPMDPKRPDRGGIELIATRKFPLLESIAAWEILFMALWTLWTLWPVWNRLVNGVLLQGDRDRIRSARRVKLVACLALSGLAAGGWYAGFGPVEDFGTVDYKAGITSGSIALLAEGETSASLVTPEGAVESAEDASAGLVGWAPIPYGYAELHEDEKFRPPTWRRAAERDPETGRPVHLESYEDDVTGVTAESKPVEIRAAELPLNHPWRHALGTDESGRDVLTRMVWGARTSLSVGILSALLLTIIGVVIGSIAGFFGGLVDDVIMRGIEILQSIPALFLILLALAFTPPGTIPPMFAIVIVIAVVRWTGVARLVRGEFMRLRDQEFVIASRALGFSSRRTIFRHVLPNAMSPVLVAAAFSVAAGILTESAVSFLGLGIKEPDASWGGVVNESRNPQNWWIQVFPGLAIFITVTCYNLVGDAIRDAMDPKMKV